jgi:hypothetical protein
MYITNLYSSRYDWDAATTANFLRKYGLTGNIFLYLSFKYLPKNQKMGVMSFYNENLMLSNSTPLRF